MLAPLVLENLQAATSAPVILTNPASITVQAGLNANFTVIATGINLSYQWFRNGAPISGATSATLSYGPTAFPSDNGAQFTVTVSNIAGFATAGVAILTVLLAAAAPSVAKQTTAQDIILGALLNINAYAPGQPLQASSAEVALGVLNDLMDSLSNDKYFVYTQTEYVFPWVSGKFTYSIGNPVGGTFTATVVAGSNLLTNVTLPSNLVLGGTLMDLYGAIPANTTVTALGTNTVTMSVPAAFGVMGADTVTFTSPGDIPYTRPLRINSGFTRITNSIAGGLDYWFECKQSLDRYNEIGFKSVPGPWPFQLAYQPTYPLGTFRVYPSPIQSGIAHLYVDLILQNFATLTQPLALPQGYARALKKLLALELCPAYGKNPSPQLVNQAKEAKGLLKDTNATPQVTLRYDSDLIYSRHTDAGWILSGGFN